jgi:hypothetical protein
MVVTADSGICAFLLHAAMMVHNPPMRNNLRVSMVILPRAVSALPDCPTAL